MHAEIKMKCRVVLFNASDLLSFLSIENYNVYLFQNQILYTETVGTFFLLKVHFF